MTYRLGKRPARHNSIELKLMHYLSPSVLPKIPAEFGHERLVSNYGMLANDRFGCCVFSGAAHECMLWNSAAAHNVSFTDAAVLSDYSALTGFDPNNPSMTDNGTDMQQAASYRLKTGILDAAGKRHKVGAYLALTPGNADELAAAAYIFGAVGIGLMLPQYALDEFDAGQPWKAQKRRGRIAGGHYVPIVARRGGMFYGVTWGKMWPIEPAFCTQSCDEAIVYLSDEFLTAGLSPEGFNRKQLLSDLRAVTTA